MRPDERRADILAMADSGEDLSVEALARRFSVSRETVRRDLVMLGETGRLRRVHGGAEPSRMAIELPFQQRRTEHADAKRRIAACASALFTSGDTLMIDTGSTTEAFAAALGATVLGHDLTVITNSVRIAAHLPQAATVLGGSFRKETGQMLGTMTVAALGEFSADHAVLGIGAIDAEHGAMDYDLEEAALACTMIGRSTQVTILADHTKFGRRALVRVCTFRPLVRIVTDEMPEPRMAAALDALGVTLIIA